jgi:hypothetical protein
MKLYVEMDELQFEKYKESIKKAKDLTDFPSTDLAAALLNVIQKENGEIDTSEKYDATKNVFIKTSAARIIKSNFIISLIIEKYGAST